MYPTAMKGTVYCATVAILLTPPKMINAKSAITTTPVTVLLTPNAFSRPSAIELD